MLLLFFFQAEDGIRDLVRSRGLGDVYKRQSLMGGQIKQEISARGDILSLGLDADPRQWGNDTPVSYTHLTLPTSDLV